MRLAQFLVAVATVTVAAHRADAQAPAAQPGTISIAWPAPVGHFQPRARDIPPDVTVVPSRSEQEVRNRALDEKLEICRGC